MRKKYLKGPAGNNKTTNMNTQSLSITEDETIYVTKRQKNKKAKGVDDMPAKII